MSKVKQQATVKTILDVPAYRVAAERLTQLRSREGAIRLDLVAVGAALGSARQAAPSGIFSEAKLLLTEEEATDSGPAIGDLEDQYDNLRHEQQVVAAAVKMQTRIVATARTEASKIVCRALADEWKDLALTVRVLAGKLAAAATEEQNFREDLRMSDCLLCSPISDQAGVSENFVYRCEYLAKEIDEALKNG